MSKPGSFSSASSFIMWIALACIICMFAKAPFALAHVQCTTSGDSPTHGDAKQAVKHLREQDLCLPPIWPSDCTNLTTYGTATVQLCGNLAIPCTEIAKLADKILAKCAESVNGADRVAGYNTWMGPPPIGPPFGPQYVEILRSADVLSSMV